MRPTALLFSALYVSLELSLEDTFDETRSRELRDVHPSGAWITKCLLACTAMLGVDRQSRSKMSTRMQPTTQGTHRIGSYSLQAGSSIRCLLDSGV
jgi:hypothetical protein